MYVRVCSSLWWFYRSCLLMPKSLSLASPRLDSIRILSGFKSLCIYFLSWCMYLSACKSCEESSKIIWNNLHARRTLILQVLGSKVWPFFLLVTAFCSLQQSLLQCYHNPCTPSPNESVLRLRRLHSNVPNINLNFINGFKLTSNGKELAIMSNSL